MLKLRQGFTLIELLIVVVIIGILAAIAIPKFSKTREKAYFSAMQTDLKNFMSAEEIYYSSNNYNYSDTLPTDFVLSKGVTIDAIVASTTGWSATAAHAALATTQTCAVYYGQATAVAPATSPGVVSCTGEQ